MVKTFSQKHKRDARKWEANVVHVIDVLNTRDIVYYHCQFDQRCFIDKVKYKGQVLTERNVLCPTDKPPCPSLSVV